MRKLVAAFVAVLAMVTMTSVVDAQVSDHLKCFKIKDPANFKAQVLLDAYQINFNDPPGVPPGCFVAGKAKFFCVPVEKTVVTFVDKTKPPLAPVNMIGQHLQYDQLCYKIKCPNPAITQQDVQDQFGSRTISGFVPQWLCAPTIKLDDQPTTCAASPYPQCGGVCPKTTDICRPKNDGTPGCDCIPTDPLCDQSAPQCNGACPNAAQTCVATADGKCYCSDVAVLCEQSSAPQCGGYCPSNLTCREDTTGKCRCTDVPCGLDATGICGGACPTGHQCVSDAATGQCGCN